MGGQTQRFTQQSIDPHPHDKCGFKGLDMHVGHALPHRFCNHAVDQTNDRGVICGIEQIICRGHAADEKIALFFRAELSGGSGRRAIQRIGARQLIIEKFVAGRFHRKRTLKPTAQFRQGADIGTRPHQNPQATLSAVLEEDPMFAHKSIGQDKRVHRFCFNGDLFGQFFGPSAAGGAAGAASVADGAGRGISAPI